MFADFNIRAVFVLIIISVISFSSHRLGLLNVSLVLSDNKNHRETTVLSMGETHVKLEQLQDSSVANCRVTQVKEFNLCGISYVLTDNLSQGVDLSVYDRVALNIKYKSLIEGGKLKVSLRNFNAKYANSNDFVSLKFNTITYNPTEHADRIIVPMSAFQVENWWVSEYKINFDNSYHDVTNVGFVEVIAQGLSKPGDYQITVSDITLYGELISEKDFLKLVLLLWLLSAVVLVVRQKNIHSRLSSTDVLTGKLNRRGLKNYIESDVLTDKETTSFYLAYINIDNFKKVNDTFGHFIGDELLIEFPKIICKLLNKKHKVKYKIARLSGGEYALLLQTDALLKATNIIASILQEYHQPILIKKHKIYIKVCIGAVAIDSQMTTFESILLRADSALVYAKNKGEYQYKVFDESVADEIFFRKSVVAKIKTAIEENDFTLNYMPIVSSSDFVTRHVEVLLRSHSGSLKGIGPDIFIPIAEKYNLIEEIDLWVIEAVFKQIKSAGSFVLNTPLIFCINISAAELHNYDFTKKLSDLLASYQINPQQIELEITETSLIEIDDRSIQVLQDIKSMGITLALDDFGTGYTAFNQLLNYPVDCLKIDKSFVDFLCSDNRAPETMVKAIISIAQSYGLHTIAEGVETEQQYKLLKKLGCDMLQGYYFSKPLPWQALVRFMGDNSEILKVTHE